MKTYLYRASNLNSTITFLAFSDRFSIFRENPSEKDDYDNYYMNLSQEMTVFGGYQKLTSGMKLRPEK